MCAKDLLKLTIYVLLKNFIESTSFKKIVNLHQKAEKLGKDI